jgi:hypothetical protein
VRRAFAALAACGILCAAAWSQAPGDASAWQYRLFGGDRRLAHVQIKASGPGGVFDATLLFSRHATEAGRKPVTKGGVTTPPVIVELCIHDAKQAAPFRLDDFEGPDAPASRLKLARIQVRTDAKPWSRDFKVSGWYSNLSVVLNPVDRSSTEQRSGEPLAFVFGLGDSIRDYRDLLELIDRLTANPGAFTIQISPLASGEPLKFNVPLSGVIDALKKLTAK